ncbi:hypothetical protein B0H10DRAFT_2436035 [Mycena sp. CBHHK59/15]|nr:hypothetical protein B0H10DRAFT_2436035 [Mycena sp. CBHHK59/15]
MKDGSELPLKRGRAVLEAKAALAIRGPAHRTDVAGDGESGSAPSSSHIAPRTITSTQHSSATMSTLRSRADIELIDGLPTRVLTDFRDYMFTEPYIAANPRVFLDTLWISIPVLRAFLEVRDLGGSERPMMISFPEPPVVSRVKREFNASNASLMSLTVKSEAMPAALPCRTRSQIEGGREVLEILSDSDDDEPPQWVPPVRDQRSGTQYSSPDFTSAEGSSLELDSTNRSAFDSRRHKDASRSSSPGEFDKSDADESDTDESVTGGLHKSDTVWLDPHVSSMVRVVNMNLTSDSRTHIERLEYLSEIPTGFPVPRVPTAFIVDLSDPKFNLLDDDGNLFGVDVLVSGQDNDSWKGSSGAADPVVDVKFGPGETAINCRRKRQDCRGCRHCNALDKSLVNVTRYELDATSRDAALEAQRETRRHEGETAEQRATGVQSTPCKATHADGRPCQGRPKLMLKKEGKSRGHLYWVACDGWTREFRESHRTHSIPDNVDEQLLLKLFAGKALANDDSVDTNGCSRIVHPHIGGKLKYCRHPHIIKGKAVAQCPIVHRKCGSKRTYYIPVDPTIRKVLIFHPKSVPHNHPIAPPLKLSHDAKSHFLKCVHAVGLIGTSVAKVDNAPSTQLLLGGKRPGQFAAGLHNTRLKQDILGNEKKKKYPAGLGVTGAYDLYHQDLKKPLNERYIHRFQHAPGGGLIIFTCYTSLLSLLDDPGVKVFEDDTTFKRVAGDLNEWEVVIFYNALERAITLARMYIDRSDTKFFELLFNIFREIKIEATGKDIGFARFMPNRNLLVMNADMEAAQALGAARSFLKTNVSSFSNITTLDPQFFATFFINPLPEFASLVNSEDYKWLKDFMYIDSVESLKSFSDFIASLGVKKIQDWWAHKEMNDWVIPCLVKSQSNILPEHWDSTPATTNTGEAQHHWTNSRTVIKLTLVEGIERRGFSYALDILEDVEISTTTGVLRNSNNEMFHRQGRSSQRQSNAAKKSRESAKLGERKAELLAQINEQVAGLKASKAEYKSMTGTGSRSSGSSSRKPTDDSVIVSASSCGRVKTVPLPKRGKAVLETSPIPATDKSSIVVETFGTQGTDAVFTVNANSSDVAISEPQTALPAILPVISKFIPTLDYPFAPPLIYTDFAPAPISSAPVFYPGNFGKTFSNESDLSANNSDYNFELELFSIFGSVPQAPAFDAEFLGASGSGSNSGGLAYTPFEDDFSLSSALPDADGWGSRSQAGDWCLLSPQQELPLLPPLLSSSPPFTEPAEGPVSAASTPPPVASKDIDLAFSEKNILHSKRQRTMSSRAAVAVTAPPAKKPRSR